MVEPPLRGVLQQTFHRHASQRGMSMPEWFAEADILRGDDAATMAAPRPVKP